MNKNINKVLELKYSATTQMLIFCQLKVNLNKLNNNECNKLNYFNKDLDNLDN